MDLMLRFCDTEALRLVSAVVGGQLPDTSTLFAWHRLSYGYEVRKVRRSFRSSIHRSTRLLFDGLTRSEEAASGKCQRTCDAACSDNSFHSATSLRRKRLLATESSHVRCLFTALAITCHKFFSRSPSSCHGNVQF
jgi:hypothetical protein